MSKDISITALATDDEIHQLWEIVGKILDRSKLDDDGELSVRLLANIDEDFKVTTKQVSEWVGDSFVWGYNSREEALLEIITDVANGKYDIAELNADIMQWEDFKRICE
jgi:hypothetical protein